ncbi:hypothetical protein [Pseudonocardia alaniniphila]|uniref:Uncharacterized protein n=1 Tax=Pseudonocardia alaniniphila TaxID=75291 RepID=A0ABS9TND8_9PSEU|nr:hypothetical protein [Pseudonocardia alaniniphila]MCH6170049.1 hypothetical protein [Pseudonocardia alaniniphila]
MDLTARLLRFAAARPHVLVVPAVGGTAQRLAVEAELARRGWPVAPSPADTDVLVVAGTPGPELAAVVERLWQQIPAPRARVDVATASTAAPALDRAAADLADTARQRREPARPSTHARHGEHREPLPSERGTEHGEHEQHEHGEHQPGSHQHAGHQQSGHHQHGGGMGMAGGLPMADVGPDRDGLMLDRLRVPLGPVLPDWPAGLVVDVVLQGDVVQEASARVLDPPAHDHAALPAFWSDADSSVEHTRRRAARHLDALARLLGTAGWGDPAATARHLRDELLAGAPEQALRPRADALVERVRRSRMLRRMLRGVGSGAGDVTALLAARLAALPTALAAVDDPAHADDDPGDTDTRTPDELAALLVGAELAAARLIVAAVDPDTDRITVPRAGQAPHG